MPNRVNYEWDMEELDREMVDAGSDDPDIIDHDHRDKLSELGLPSDQYRRLVLVRDEGNAAEGIVDRLWAYVDESRMLPRNFSNSEGKETMVAVPQRFHREIAREACRK